MIEPLGDRGFLARFDDEAAASSWAEAVRAARLAGVVDVVLAYATAAVLADPDRVDLDGLGRRLAGIKPARAIDDGGRLIELPVLYDGDDLADVAGRLGMAAEEVVTRHAAGTYRVFAIGFLPGFPYAGYLPAELSGLARRDSPRLRVPAGSVAIAGRQTGVYPAESPGGWHLIGRTPLRIVDPEAADFPIRAGDRLRFRPIDVDEYERRRGERLGPAG